MGSTSGRVSSGISCPVITRQGPVTGQFGLVGYRELDDSFLSALNRLPSSRGSQCSARLFRLLYGTIPGVIITNNPQGFAPALNDHEPTFGDRLVLTTVVGATDLLAEDLHRSGSTKITIASEDSVCCQFDEPVSVLRGIATYRTAGIVLDSASVRVPDLTAIRASIDHGVLGRLGPDSPLRFRVGVPGTEDRNTVIDAVRSQAAWENAPTDWHINLTRRNGWWVAEVGCLHYSRRLIRLRRQPWSTNPVLATVLVRIAKVNDGQIVHDPFCGTGTVLIAAHRANASVRLTGTDHDGQSLEMARANLDDSGVRAILVEADAIPFQHATGAVHRIVSNLPFGKQVGSHTNNTRLYPALIDEISRTLHPAGRAVLLTEDKRLLVESVNRTSGLKIIRQRLLRYGGATPTAYTITRTRTTQRPSPRRRSTSIPRRANQS